MRTRLVVRDGKVIELKEDELVREPSSPQVFSIGGKSGFKWKTESANKTWIENGKIVKEKKGKAIPK
tara:strand:- start:1193 stop:1393 length:201 start_codon:yes stop_codon:yes gene_type:complete